MGFYNVQNGDEMYAQMGDHLAREGHRTASREAVPAD